MRKIDFKAGYYEWLVLVDNEIVYSFNFDEGMLPEVLTNKKDFDIISESIVENMQEDFAELDNGTYEGLNEITNPYFTKEELEFVKKLISDTLYYNYGD